MSKWMVYSKKADFKSLSIKYGVDQVIVRIARNRDVCSDSEFDMYFSDSEQIHYDVSTLKDADKGTDIVIGKIKENKKIRIVGDYDIGATRF